MTKLDGPERRATIKPVFSQNEMVVDFDYCIITAGATSVPFTSGAVRKTDGFKCFQGFLLYHSLRGGTGSGTGTLLTSRCAKNTRSCHGNILRHPINEGVRRCIRAVQRSPHFHEFQENPHEYMFLKSGALYHICFRKLNITTPTFGDLLRVRFDFQDDHVLSIPVRLTTIGRSFPIFDYKSVFAV